MHFFGNIDAGQAIPAGLHVRLNLQTGEREAKLLDDPKVHQDLIGRLLDQLKKTNQIDEQISVLKELEDLLHQFRLYSLFAYRRSTRRFFQYDHAVRFTNLNGLEYLQLLLKSQTTNEEIRNWLLLTLGAAFQG